MDWQNSPVGIGEFPGGTHGIFAGVPLKRLGEGKNAGKEEIFIPRVDKQGAGAYILGRLRHDPRIHSGS